MMYKFLGTPCQIFPFLIRNKVYDLTIRKDSDGPLGWLVGNTKPTITQPFYCPYDSWYMFYKNWEVIV